MYPLYLKLEFEQFIKRGTAFRKQKDFTQLSNETLLWFHGGPHILSHHKSFYIFLSSSYRQFFWSKVWRFPSSSSPSKKRMYLDSFILSHFQDVHTQRELFGIPFKQYCSMPSGGTIMNIYKSTQAMYRLTYPELDEQWSSVHLSANIEENEKRRFIDRFILRHFRFVETQWELAEVTSGMLGECPGGLTLLKIHEDSPQWLFQQNYPQLIMRSKMEHRGFWKNMKKFALMMSVRKAYCIKEREDWYRLSNVQFAKVYGKVVSKENMIRLLEFWNPEEDWDYFKFSEGISKKSSQRYLGLKLKEIFGEELVLEEKVVVISKKMWTFDFYVPSRSLVVEYQGEQHYFSVFKWLDVEKQRNRDLQKKSICAQMGLVFVDVPYWWDGTSQQLWSIIQQQTTPPSPTANQYLHQQLVL
eukprot:TRINITY_DN3171_c0_g2_i4.p1 TRINITY_DN3171_c0_g2~~TRINITY_DN3171_c0_g2_i4.p1  ORF type:complete len:426 (-),score=94.43 TRINITY_DN3171_c0_g2_i4:1012-2253(-)